MGLIRILVFIFIISIVFRIIFRWIIPYFFKSYVNKVGNRMRDSAQQRASSSDGRDEGEVIIESKSRSNRPESKDNGKGDYIEYEEVE